MNASELKHGAIDGGVSDDPPSEEGELTITVQKRKTFAEREEDVSTVTMQSDNSSSRLSSSLGSLSISDFPKRHNSSDLSSEAEQKKLKPAKFRESRRKIAMSLPVSRLQFSSLGLVGRDEEKALLETCLKRVAPGSRELVLLSGDAGTGKSVLAYSLRKSVKKLDGLYVKGKFDLYQRDEPYSGIAAAFREICGAILSLRGDETFDQIRSELIGKLGPENLSVLTNIVGELVEIVGDDSIIENTMEQSSEETKARCNYAFRILIRIVANRFAPLVILLDDIQWADAATLDLLQTLITDRDNPSLMVIGVYRSNEVDDAHPLTPRIREMKRGEERDDYRITEIQIGDLNSSQTNEILMKLLSVDEPSKTLGLANVCYKRTRGNAFSLVVFLEMLQEEGLLEYNIGRFAWGWDDETILSATAATSNVVDLMKQKIKRLPSSASQRLSIAACLGFSFEPAVLETVWSNIASGEADGTQEKKSTEDDDENDMRGFLELVEQDGFLEREQSSRSTSYRWVHDKVQEAAMSIVPKDDLSKLKTQVGKILIDAAVDLDKNSYLFTAVTLLSEGGLPEEESSRIQIVELSLLASKKAKGQSAFESAGKYADIGIASLPTNKWSDHYDLTLDLYSTAAEVAGYLGNAEALEKCFDEVLNQQDRPLYDKLRAYRAMISYMIGAFGRPEDAMKLILQILSQLGLSFPRRKSTRLLSTISGLQKAKKKLSSFEPNEIRKFPTMHEPIHLEMMRLLDQLFTAAYMSKSDMLPLSILASFQLTMKYGLSEYAAPAFACIGLLLGAALGDFALATKTGNIARLTMTVVDSKNMEAQTEFWLNGFVFCWTDLSARMTSRFLQSYETGLSVGDNEYACWSIAFYLDYVFLTGKPLVTVEADCKIYLKQMIEFKREVAHADMSIFFEMIRNLIGRYEGDPTVITGAQRFLSHSDHFVHVWFYSCQSILYMYFGDDEKGAELAIERGDAYAKGVPGQMWNMIDAFARGMPLYSMARRTKKRRFKRQAWKVHKVIKSWVRKGNPNVQHYDLLMDAESAVLGRKLDAAKRYYLAAIASATRQGFIHESAFACERYGEFLLNEGSDPEEAGHQLGIAMQRYEEWGAVRKASMLREKYKGLWHKDKPAEVVVNGGDKSGSTF